MTKEESAGNERPVEVGHPLRRWHRLFAVAVLICIILGQEAGFRAIFPLPEASGFNRVHYQLLVREDSRFEPIVKRGLVYDRLRFESLQDGFSEVHRLNLYGFRGDDFAIERPTGRRILVLGDSVTEGVGASADATISAVLAERLRSDGDKAEVINLGVVAASLDEITPLARDSISLLKPTDVVVVLYANDLPVSEYLQSYDDPAPVFPRRKGLRMVPRALELIGRLACAEPIYRRWPPMPSLPFFSPVPDPTNPWTTMRSPPCGLDPAIHEAMAAGTINPWLWRQSRGIPIMLSHDFSGGDGSPSRHLARIAACCKAENARLVVAYVPFCGVASGRYTPSLIQLGMDRSVAKALAMDPIYRRQNVMLAGVCRDLDLPLADTTEAIIRAESRGEAQYWPYDTHPRPAGYSTIALDILRIWRAAELGPPKREGR